MTYEQLEGMIRIHREILKIRKIFKVKWIFVQREKIFHEITKSRSYQVRRGVFVCKAGFGIWNHILNKKILFYGTC